MGQSGAVCEVLRRYCSTARLAWTEETNTTDTTDICADRFWGYLNSFLLENGFAIWYFFLYQAYGFNMTELSQDITGQFTFMLPTFSNATLFMLTLIIRKLRKYVSCFSPLGYLQATVLQLNCHAAFQCSPSRYSLIKPILFETSSFMPPSLCSFYV